MQRRRSSDADSHITESDTDLVQRIMNEFNNPRAPTLPPLSFEDVFGGNIPPRLIGDVIVTPPRRPNTPPDNESQSNDVNNSTYVSNNFEFDTNNSTYASANFDGTTPTELPFADMSRTLGGIIDERRTQIECITHETLNVKTDPKIQISTFVRWVMDKHANFFKNKGITKTIKEVDALKERFSETVSNAEFVSVAFDTIETELISKVADSQIQTFKEQCIHLLEIYRRTTKKLIDTEKELTKGLDRFKSIQAPLEFLLKLDTNEASAALIEASTAKMADTYTEYMKLVSQWTALRDLFTLHGIIQSSEENRSPICTICIEDHVSLALIPCGHTFCRSCKSQFGRVCPVCRTVARGTQTVYF
jgi:hypothetical protein